MPETLETKEANSTLAHDCAFLRAYGEYLYTGKEPRPFINSARAIKEVVERSATLIESQAAEIERLKAVTPVRVAKPVIVEGEGQADDIGRTGSDDSPDRDAILEARRKAIEECAALADWHGVNVSNEMIGQACSEHATASACTAEEELRGSRMATQADADECALLETEHRKMTKIVYNACFGGFGLSDEAVRRYAEIKGLRLYIEDFEGRFAGFGLRTYWLAPPEERTGILSDDEFHQRPQEERIASNKRYDELTFTPREISRADPALVQVVEELGSVANGPFADLKIAEIPAGTRYRIDEYDGSESVMTVDDYEWETA